MNALRGCGLVFALAAATVLCAPTVPVLAITTPSSYKSCAEFRAAWPRGVARTIKASRKQKVRPAVNWFIYDQNAKLDRDKDATVCEVHGPLKPSKVLAESSTTSTVDLMGTVPLSSSSTSSSIPADLVCPIAFENVTSSVTSSVSEAKIVKLPNDVLRVTRIVKGKLTNKSSLAIELSSLTLSTIFNGDQFEMVDAMNSDVIISAGEVFKWTTKYVQEVSPKSSLGNGTYAFDVTVDEMVIFTDDPRCL